MIEKGEGNNEGQYSYWKMQKSEMKDKNLHYNMLPQINEALVEVVERKGQRVFGGGGGGSSNSNPNIMSFVLGQVERLTCSIVLATYLVVLALPPPLSLLCSQPLSVVDSHTSEYSDSPAMRREEEEEESNK